MKYINVNLCSGIDIGRLAWEKALKRKGNKKIRQKGKVRL